MSYSTLIVTHIWPFIAAILETTFHKDVASWKEYSDLVLKLNYLEMDVCVVSDMCHCSSLKHLICPGDVSVVFRWLPRVPRHKVWEHGPCVTDFPQFILLSSDSALCLRDLGGNNHIIIQSGACWRSGKVFCVVWEEHVASNRMRDDIR